MLTVLQATLAIAGNNVSKILNASLPALSASYSGFVNGEGASALRGGLKCTTTATAASPVGNYPITCSGQSFTNYAITYKSGTLSIIYQPGGSCGGGMGHIMLQPINADGTSVWKQGRTIPAKFRVCDANGMSIGTVGVVSSFSLTRVIAGTVADVDEILDSTATDTVFRWVQLGSSGSAISGQQTSSPGMTYVYAVTLNDGSTIVFQYGLK